jgi:hypothetical protein
MKDLFLMDEKAQLVERGTTNNGFVVWLEGNDKEYNFTDKEPKEIIDFMVKELDLKKGEFVAWVLTNYGDDNDTYHYEWEDQQ